MAGPLFKRPDSKIWWYRFKFQGQKYVKSTGETDKGEALRTYHRERAKIENNPSVSLSKEVTFAHLAALDIERAESERQNLGAQTITTLEIAWKHLADFFGIDSRPDVVTLPAVRDYIAARRKKVKGQTIRREVQALKRGLKLARERDLIKSMLDAWPTIKGDPKDKDRAGKVHPFEVLVAFIEEVGRRSADAHDEIQLAILTGLRSEELKRLSFSWIKAAPAGGPTPAVIELPDWATKDRDSRFVGCPRLALRIIQRRARGLDDDEPILFGGKHRTVYRNAAKAIGYDKRITLRDCRHTFATMADRLSGDRKAVQDLLGHSSASITELYLHSDALRMLNASQSVANWYESGTVPVARLKSIDSNTTKIHSTFEDLNGRGERIRTSDPLTPSPSLVDELGTFRSNNMQETSTQDSEMHPVTVREWYSSVAQDDDLSIPWADPDDVYDDVDN